MSFLRKQEPRLLYGWLLVSFLRKQESRQYGVLLRSGLPLSRQ